MLSKEELPKEERERIEEGNKPKQSDLDRIAEIAKEIQKNEEILFEQRVNRILARHGLIILPTGKEG
jgi:hypothetical protein